jgi:hypothetical protein
MSNARELVTLWRLFRTYGTADAPHQFLEDVMDGLDAWITGEGRCTYCGQRRCVCPQEEEKRLEMLLEKLERRRHEKAKKTPQEKDSSLEDTQDC